MSRRVLLDTTNGLKVSKAGFDAGTASTEDLVFSPAYRLQKVVQVGSAAFVQGPGSTSVTNTDIPFGTTYSFPPRARVIINFASLNGGLSTPRSQMQFSSSLLIGKDVAAVPNVNNPFSGDSPSHNFLCSNPGIRVYTDKLRILGRVGAGTIYYEIYEVLE